MPIEPSRGRPRRPRSTPAIARSPCTSRSGPCSGGGRSTLRSRRSRSDRCSGSSAVSRTSCSSASSRSSSPAESRRMPRSRRAWSSRAASSGRARPGLTNAVLRRIAAEGPEWYAALPEDDARGGRPAAFAARLDRRAVVRRLRRGAGEGAVRGGQSRTCRSRCGPTRCAAGPPPWTHGSPRPGPSPCATRRPASCASRARSTSRARTRLRAAPSCRSPGRRCSWPAASARSRACASSISAPRPAARRRCSRRAARR